MKLFATTTVEETTAAINVIINGDVVVLKARDQRMHRVRSKVLFAATTSDETAVAIDAIMDGDYAAIYRCNDRLQRSRHAADAHT